MEPARVWAIKAVVLGRTFFVDPCPECGQAEVRIREDGTAYGVCSCCDGRTCFPDEHVREYPGCSVCGSYVKARQEEELATVEAILRAQSAPPAILRARVDRAIGLGLYSPVIRVDYAIGLGLRSPSALRHRFMGLTRIDDVMPVIRLFQPLPLGVWRCWHGGMHQAQRAFGNSRPAAASQIHEETNP